MLRSLLACALAVPCLAVAARADTIKVSSGVAADLQAALDAAAPGDTIRISGGPYVGNFSIGEGKDGLVLKGKAVIDAQGGNHGFVIDSDDVTLSQLTIRHPDDDAIRAPGSGDPLAGLTISKCTILDGYGLAVAVTGDDVSLLSVVADGCDAGFSVIGDRGTVSKCRVLNTVGQAITVGGEDASVRGNTVEVCDNVALSVTGEGAVVEGNDLSVVSSGVLVSSAGGVVAGNDVRFCDSIAFNIVGNEVEVSGNEVEGAGVLGLVIGGTDVIVTKNRVRDSQATGDALRVLGNGAIVDSNTVERTSGSGFILVGNEGIVSRNRAVRCGTSFGAGFLVDGNENVFEKNTAQDCDDTGFVVDGDQNELLGNTSTGHGNNGFWILGISSTGNVLDGNVAKSNDGEGLQNGGVGTVIRKNKLSKNQLDLANETGAGATLDDQGGNVFSTGGLTTEPVVDT